jgi:hypothetical protein
LPRGALVLCSFSTSLAACAVGINHCSIRCHFGGESRKIAAVAFRRAPCRIRHRPPELTGRRVANHRGHFGRIGRPRNAKPPQSKPDGGGQTPESGYRVD